MRVKLCRRCPYTPRDLADHYDPEAALHVCAKCDGEQAMLTNHYPREVHRRRKCATVHIGLIRHYACHTALCSRKCADRFKARQVGDRRWLLRLRAA